MTQPNEHFTALCDSLRKEGGKHSGDTKIIAIAFDGDMSVTFESIPDREYADVAWSDFLRIAVRRYLDNWEGESFDRERALASLQGDMDEILDEYREDHGMNEEDAA
jgi:hypothetical protein